MLRHWSGPSGWSTGATLHRLLATPTRRAVPAGEDAEPPVGEGKPSLGGGNAGHEAEAFQRRDDVGDAGFREVHQARHVPLQHPGPVGEQVEGAFLGWLEEHGQRACGVRRQLAGQGRQRGRGFGSRRVPGAEAFQHVAQVQRGGHLGGTPYEGVDPGEDRVALQGEEGGDGGADEGAPGVSQPDLVGDDDEHGAGDRPPAEPPQPLGEGRAVGGVSLPDDADAPLSGDSHGCVQGSGAVQTQPQGEFEACDRGGQAVEGGDGVEPVEQHPPPPAGDGMGAKEVLNGGIPFPGQPAQPVCGEAVAPGRGREVGGVGDRVGESTALKPLDGVVDCAPGDAGDGRHLLPV